MKEERDTPTEGVSAKAHAALGEAREALRSNRDLRRLAAVGALFGMSILLFPHYQAIARERLGLTYENMMLWVVLQNAGTAMFSFLIGPMADKRGNRRVLLVVMSIVSLSPVLAIALSYSGDWGARLYPIVFLSIGLTPNVFRTFNNYTLELCGPADHPRFLSTISLFIAGPAFASPLVGYLIRFVGMDVVFGLVTVLLFIGWAYAFGLREPRNQAKPTSDSAR